MRITSSIGNGGAALRALDDLRKRAENLTPVFRGIGSDVKAEADLSFRESRDPYGTPWKPLAPATIENRRGQGKGVKALLDTGALRNSIGIAAGADQVTIGTVLSYAAVHQFGAAIAQPPRAITVRLRQITATRKDGTKYKATRFAKTSHKRVREVEATVPARTINIPARPYLPTSDRGLPVDIAASIRDRLASHFRGVAE